MSKNKEFFFLIFGAQKLTLPLCILHLW